MIQNSTQTDTSTEATFDELSSGPATEPSTVDQSAVVTPEAEAPSLPEVYREGNDLVLVNGANLTPHICIKSGKPVKSTIEVGLQSPFQPKTWFKSEKVSVGLNRQHLEKHRINQALAITLISLGAVMIPVGILSGVATLFVGLVVCLAGLVVRSLSPVWCQSRSENSVTVKGCGENYLKHFSTKG